MSVRAGGQTAAGSIGDYEARMAEQLGCRRAIAFSNARTGIGAVLKALGAAAGDEVVLSPVTCKVVPLSVMALGLVPRYADVDSDTLNLDADRVADAVGPRTRAILFQHTYGLSEGLDRVTTVARERGVAVLEDRAQCVPLASPLQGVAAVYSNNLLKPLPAGSGGLAVTNDPGLMRALDALATQYPEQPAALDRSLRVSAFVHDHVLSPRLYWPMLSLYSRLDAGYKANAVEHEIAAFVVGAAHRASALQVRRGLASLPTLAAVAATRRAHVAEYARALGDTPGVRIPRLDATLPLLYFPVCVTNKRRLLERAQHSRVEMVPWPNHTPIYAVEDPDRLPLYGYRPGSCPAAERVASELVGLPTHPGVTAAHREHVIGLVRETVN